MNVRSIKDSCLSDNSSRQCNPVITLSMNWNWWQQSCWNAQTSLSGTDDHVHQVQSCFKPLKSIQFSSIQFHASDIVLFPYRYSSWLDLFWSEYLTWSWQPLSLLRSSWLCHSCTAHIHVSLHEAPGKCDLCKDSFCPLWCKIRLAVIGIVISFWNANKAIKEKKSGKKRNNPSHLNGRPYYSLPVRKRNKSKALRYLIKKERIIKSWIYQRLSSQNPYQCMNMNWMYYEHNL